jgi:hypothetical protein
MVLGLENVGHKLIASVGNLLHKQEVLL